MTKLVVAYFVLALVVAGAIFVLDCAADDADDGFWDYVSAGLFWPVVVASFIAGWVQDRRANRT